MPRGVKKQKLSPEQRTLAVMRGLVSSLTHNSVPDDELLDQLQNYFTNLQDSANLMGLALFQHNMTKLLRVSEGIEELHGHVLNPSNISKNIKKDPYYGLELLKILYKEAGVATLILEGKTKIFDKERLEGAKHMQPKRIDAGREQLSKVSPKSRENIRKLLESLTDDTDNDDDDEPNYRELDSADESSPEPRGEGGDTGDQPQ